MSEAATPTAESPVTYRTLEALEELAELVDTARGVPMSASCVLPRGSVLDLIDDIRDALPAELVDAQDVLDQREELLAAATEQLTEVTHAARAERERIVGSAEIQAGEMVRSARDRAEQVLTGAEDRAERLLAQAHAQEERILAHARAEAETMVAAARQEASRLIQQSEVYQAAASQAEQVRAEAGEQARQMIAEAEEYVDGRLVSLGDLLTRTLRQVDKGRQALRERSPRLTESTDGRRLR